MNVVVNQLLAKAGTIPSFTWAQALAAVTSFVGQCFISDVGVNGSMWYSNGTALIHEAPIVLQQSAIPIILPSSGTLGNNGALTLTTALPMIFSDGCYMYFPAGAIYSGSTAGLYYVDMSTTTAGTIYNNTYLGGVASIPSSPALFSSTGPGLYTQTTGTDITVSSVTVLGGLMGINGVLRIVGHNFCSNSANNKANKVFLGVSVVASQILTTAGALITRREVVNAGVETRQSCNNWNHAGTNTLSAPSVSFVNTTVDLVLSHTAQLSVATDYLILSAITVEILPS